MRAPPTGRGAAGGLGVRRTRVPGRRRCRPGGRLRLVDEASGPATRSSASSASAIRWPCRLDRSTSRPPGSFALRGHSIGGLGSITTNKLLATVMGEVFGKHVQAYPRYGSEKKGLPTSYSLTIADDPSAGTASCGGSTSCRSTTCLPLRSVIRSPVSWTAGRCSSSRRSPTPRRSGRRSRRWPAPTSSRRRIRVTALDTAALARARSPRPGLILRLQGVALVGAFLRMTTFAADAGLDREAMLGGRRRSPAPLLRKARRRCARGEPGDGRLGVRRAHRCERPGRSSGWSTARGRRGPGRRAGPSWRSAP